MDDLSKQFSFADFMAYFFPGAFATVGVYLFLLLSPGQKTFSNFTLDFTTGIAFLVLSYIVGVIFSGFSSGIVKQIEKMTKYKNPQDILPDDLFPLEVIKRYKAMMNINTEETVQWTRNHFRLCRSFVSHTMPSIAQKVQRHADLGLFRRNLVVPLIIWGATGVYWGVSNIMQGFISWGISVIIFSVVFTWLSINTNINRLHNSNYVETRDVLLGFIVGSKLDVTKK